MTRPPVVRWAKMRLPEPLTRALSSVEQARLKDEAALLARMRDRLRSSLGPTFDGRAPVLTRAHWFAHAVAVLKGSKWLVASALVSASVAFFGTRAVLDSTAAPAVPPSESPRTVVPAASADDAPSPSQPSARAADPQPSAAPVRSSPEVAAVERPRARGRSGNAPPSLAEELKGIVQIRQLLETSPAKSLAAAEQQQRTFAHGALAPERELLRIEALLRLGRVREAKERAAVAGRTAGNQPYREQIEKLLSGAR